MRHEYIKGHLECGPNAHLANSFTARIHKSPVEERGSIRRSPERESRDRCSAVFEVSSIRKERAC